MWQELATDGPPAYNELVAVSDGVRVALGIRMFTNASGENWRVWFDNDQSDISGQVTHWRSIPDISPP